MELVLQPTFETCGQACIAMITGKPIEATFWIEGKFRTCKYK